MKNLKIVLLSLVMLLSLNTLACHAIVPVNPTVTQVQGGINVNASSHQSTCGCSNIYWLDIEVRCVGEPFDGAPFNPGFWGPLTTYPYFQSGQLNKPGCQLTPYPTTFIPYTSMCPGVDYQVRIRENHNGQVSTWTTPIPFSVPGVIVPLVGHITQSVTAVCPNDPVELEVVVTAGCFNGLDFYWESSPDVNGSPSGVWTYEGNTNPITVYPSHPTWYRVFVDGPCTGDTLNLMVFVGILPPVNPGVASLGPDVCIGDQIQLNLTGYGGLIQWQSAPDPNGPWTNINGVNSGNDMSDPVFGPTCFRAEVSGCGQTSVSNVVCGDTLPDPIVSFSVLDVCLNQVSQFTDLSTIPIGSSLGSWSWDFGDGGTSNIQNPNYTFSGDGTFTVTLEVTSTSGCSTSFSDDVIVYPTPVVDFTGIDTTGCSPVCFTLNGSAVVNPGVTIDNYQWTFSNGIVYNTQTPTLQECFENNTTNPIFLGVNLQVTTEHGCVGSINKPNFINLYYNPIAAFDYQPTNPDILDPTVTFINNSINALTYEWHIDEIGMLTDVNPIVEFDGVPYVYGVELIAITENGCSDTVVGSVEIKDVILFFVPNTFTPDFDLFNQIWKPIFTSGFNYKNYHLTIYNRWGQIMFESFNHKVGWDGTYGKNSNKFAKDGTYTWVIEFKETMSDKRHRYTGHINLLK